MVCNPSLGYTITRDDKAPVQTAVLNSPREKGVEGINDISLNCERHAELSNDNSYYDTNNAVLQDSQESLISIVYEGGEGCEGDNLSTLNLLDTSLDEIVYNDHTENTNVYLRNLRIKNKDRIIIGHLNVNFIEKKFEPLVSLIQDKLDIAIFAETKIDSSFPKGQFAMEGFSPPFRRDRDRWDGGILLYVKDDIPCKEIKVNTFPSDIECLLIEVKLHKKKYILVAGYCPHKEMTPYFLSHVGKALDKLLSDYDNIIVIGDLNSSKDEPCMKDFCDTYNLENLIKEATCYKNAENPSSIDVILTNRKNSFQNSKALETGLSDHHKMVVSVLKTYFKKRDPIKISYRSYKNFVAADFRNELANSLHYYNKGNMTYHEFHEIFIKILDSHAPKRTKLVRGNEQPFMNKTLSKAFMHRSKLKNLFNNNPTNLNKENYRKQRNYCVGLVAREKKKYYNDLDLKILDDNKKFWQKVKPLFSDKQVILQQNIVIVEGDKIISGNMEVAEKLNNFFVKAVENLNIEQFAPTIDCDNEIMNNDIEKIIKRFDTHPSILKIKEHVKIDKKFSFSNTTPIGILDEIKRLDPNKASPSNDIPIKILIGSQDIVCGPLSHIFNSSKGNCNFPQKLKLADVAPIHKKDETTSLKNYRPVSLIPVVSKLFERDMYNQIMSHIEKYLSPYLFGYRKGHSTEQCLTVMLELWKKALDRKGTAGAILTDLSKAFDCLNHDLLLAKLAAYGFDAEALLFIRSYLKDRKQRTKINGSFSSWLEIKYGVPQGSILGPLLFNIFINDMFFFIKDTHMANYADDNTLYSLNDNLEDLIETLERETTTILDWFRTNEMKPNDDKCHLIVCNNENLQAKLGNEIIKSTSSVDLLGVTINNDLDFNAHVSNLIRKGNQKLHALARISNYLCENKLRVLMKTFVQSQFNYCPLVWMFHNRTLNHKINKLHERALRIVYKNDKSTFQELLVKDESVTIHQRNLQRLAIEMFKIKNHLSPQPMQNLFTEKFYQHDLRKKRSWETYNLRTVWYGTETICNMGPKTWDLLPNDIKESNSLLEFKQKIKRWRTTECTCRLCKTYIHGLGFINSI